MSLAREARNVAYPIPKIFAARMGPTPKISVSMVPEAFTLHLSSDALVEFRYTSIQGAHISHYLGGQPSANPSGRMLGPPSAAQQFGGSIGRELLPERIREEIPQEEYVEAV